MNKVDVQKSVNILEDAFFQKAEEIRRLAGEGAQASEITSVMFSSAISICCCVKAYMLHVSGQAEMSDRDRLLLSEKLAAFCLEDVERISVQKMVSKRSQLN